MEGVGRPVNAPEGRISVSIQVQADREPHREAVAFNVCQQTPGDDRGGMGVSVCCLYVLTLDTIAG